MLVSGGTVSVLAGSGIINSSAVDDAGMLTLTGGGAFTLAHGSFIDNSSSANDCGVVDLLAGHMTVTNGSWIIRSRAGRTGGVAIISNGG
eukprot:267611-Prymnesium_polylepis.1